MDKLQELVFREEIENIKSISSHINFRGVKIDYHDFQDNHIKKVLAMDEETIKVQAEETNKHFYSLQNQINSSLKRLSIVLESLTNKP